MREQMNVRVECQLVERLYRLANRNGLTLAVQVGELLEKAVTEAGEPWVPPAQD
jgi:predicted DNA-binding protein